MPDTDDLPTSDADTGLDGDTGDESGEQQGEDKDAVLQRRIDALEAQNAKLGRDFQSGIGRLHSLIAKADTGRGATETQQRQIEAQLEAIGTTLNVIIDDEDMPSEMRAKARTALQKAKADAELAGIRAELDAVKSGTKPEAESTGGGNDFEEGIVMAIESAGLDPDDPIFDWKGEATSIFMTQGPGAARTYFRKKIADGVTAKQAAERRQTRKDSAGKGPVPEGQNMRPLDDNLPIEQRLKWLVDNGVIPR